eukprot:3389487-Rhodomonas_salina.1
MGSIGAAGSLPMQLTVGRLLGSGTGILSFDRVGILQELHQNAMTSGGRLVTVLGQNLASADYSSARRTGNTACEMTSWLSDSTLTSLQAEGVRGSMHVVVTVGRQVSSATEIASHDAPVWNAIDLSNSGMAMSQTMTVAGMQLGTFHASLQIRAGFTDCETSSWLSDTAASCRVGVGLSQTMHLAITVDEQTGTLSEVYSYDAPRLSSSAHNAPAFGGELTVLGSAFGDRDDSLRASPGGTALEGSMWASDTSLRCLTAASGASTLRISMTVGTQVGSVTEAISFDASLSTVAPTNLAVPAGIGSMAVETLTGLGF